MSNAIEMAMPAPKTNTRLIITKMILENFKSYAGSQEIGPFHKRFSSIVGPNGSGKSNVIDALLFVFGKRATQLRLKKVSELIHKSSGHPNLQYARVAVHFQEIRDNEESEDDFELVPDSEFVVTRTANKDNTSKYTLNDKNITSTALATMLKGHGIDLDNNRFLILQGEVEQIAMMKPKGATAHEEGLLEYLEDIIGSNRFIEAIEESSKKIDELNEQRVEKVNRLKVAERERDNLSESKLEAEEFMEKEKKIRTKKNVFYQSLESTANANVTDFEARLVKVEERLQSERSKVSEAESRLSVMQKEYDLVNGEYNGVSAELAKSTSDYDAFERKDVKLQEDLKYNQAAIKKLQAIVTKEGKKEAECMKDVDELAVQIQKCQATISELEASKVEQEANHDAIMDSLQESTKELRKKVETTQAELAESEKAVSTLQTEKESITMAIQLLRSRSDKASKDVGKLTDKLSQLRGERSSAEVRLKALEGQSLGGTQERIRALQELIVKCDTEEKVLQSQLREAVMASEEAKATMTAQQQQGKGTSTHSVQQVLKAAKAGGPLHGLGVRGRLGDLATIAPEYDVAISTACGMLDYIVVDNEKAGQACITYLRESNSGRASFILLNQMNEAEAKMKRPVKTPEGTPRLFDLVQSSDPALLPAFYMALQNTLVSPTLESAVRIAYEGDRAAWRVVTQDGNLIDTSGAMSGGGKSVRSGGMKLSTGKSSASVKHGEVETDVTPVMVQKLEAVVCALREELNGCRQRKMAAEKDLKDASKSLKDTQLEVDRVHMNLSGYTQQEGDLQTRIETMQHELALSPAEKDDIKRNEAKLSSLEKEIEKKSPNLRTLQQEVASLQRQILGAGGPKLSKCNSMIESISHSLGMVHGQLTEKVVKETTLKKQAGKSTSALKKAEADMTKTQGKLTALLAEKDEMEEDAMLVINAVEGGKKKLQTLEDKLKSSTEEYKKLKTAVSKVKTVECDLTLELDKVKEEIHTSVADAKRWRAESTAVRKEYADEAREFSKLIKSVASSSSSSSAGGAVGGDEHEMMDDDASSDMQQAEAEGAVLPLHSMEELRAVDQDALKREINHLEAEKRKMEGKVNMNSLIEYLKKDASYRARLTELEEITEARNTVRLSYEEVRRQRLEEFMSGFGVISLKLKEMYQMITLGGDAELELLDSLDPFSEGIVFSVRPPKKSWKNISNLSGGEKTLSSLALVFALHHYKPTPLYVMDEIDAALDFKNVSIVANYIKDRTKNAQFVIISLRNNMFELADRLVGIYKTNDCTKSVTINPKMFAAATSGTAPSTGLTVGKCSVDREESTPFSDLTNRVNGANTMSAAENRRPEAVA
jgi:structural maintenance of chromosome 4